jgi:hypothetical protein
MQGIDYIGTSSLSSPDLSTTFVLQEQDLAPSDDSTPEWIQPHLLWIYMNLLLNLPFKQLQIFLNQPLHLCLLHLSHIYILIIVIGGMLALHLVSMNYTLLTSKGIQKTLVPNYCVKWVILVMDSTSMEGALLILLYLR